MYAFFLKLSHFMAYLGGLMLSALIILTCLSVVGREGNEILHAPFFETYMAGLANWMLNLGLGPINGDFELIEAGVAFAIFAFLPLCQISGAHATVDIFTSQMSGRTNRNLRLVTDIVFAAVLVLIAVQLFGGLQSKMRSGQTTFLIEFPVWWAYALSMLGAGVAAIVAVYMAAMRIAEATTGQPILPPDLGADH